MAEPLSLLASSGSEQIDEITCGVIEILETHFLNRIRGYYFEGSCADGAITPLSDIDLSIVFIDQQTTTEQQHFTALKAACKRISPRNLDLSCIDETIVLHADHLRFQPDWGPILAASTLKCASIPAYGADIRQAIPFVPRDVYTRTFMHFPYLVLAGQRKNPVQLSYPLDYPEPEDEFFGYTGRLLRAQWQVDPEHEALGSRKWLYCDSIAGDTGARVRSRQTHRDYRLSAVHQRCVDGASGSDSSLLSFAVGISCPESTS
jgi:hypothetical protein